MLKQRLLFFGMLLALGTYAYAAVRFTLFDQPFLAQVQRVNFPNDDIESYSDGAALDSLNGGNLWGGAYVDSAQAFGIRANDDIESNSDGTALDGLNSGLNWGGAYADSVVFTGVKATDDAESYSDTVALNGLNGGTGFGGSYSDRP